MKDILYIAGFEHFCQKDYEILNEKYSVLHINSPILIPLFLPFCKMVFAWFGNHRAALAVWLANLLHKPSVVICGGYEVARVDSEKHDFHYGWRGTWKERIAKYAFEHCTVVLAVSENAKNELLMFAKPKEVKVIYHGFDPNEYQPYIQKQEMAITVGSTRGGNLIRKGIRFFIDAAELLPSYPFVVIGELNQRIPLFKKSPHNVRFTGWMPYDQLKDMYAKAKVYIQLSLHEQFSLSTAEAMLSGCSIVASDIPALHEVVGSEGIYVNPTDKVAVSIAILEAMIKNFKGRERIIDKFPLERRKIRLYEVVDKCLHL